MGKRFHKKKKKEKKGKRREGKGKRKEREGKGKEGKGKRKEREGKGKERKGKRKETGGKEDSAVSAFFTVVLLLVMSVPQAETASDVLSVLLYDFNRFITRSPPLSALSRCFIQVEDLDTVVSHVQCINEDLGCEIAMVATSFFKKQMLLPYIQTSLRSNTLRRDTALCYIPQEGGLLIGDETCMGIYSELITYYMEQVCIQCEGRCIYLLPSFAWLIGRVPSVWSGTEVLLFLYRILSLQKMASPLVDMEWNMNKIITTYQKKLPNWSSQCVLNMLSETRDQIQWDSLVFTPEAASAWFFPCMLVYIHLDLGNRNEEHRMVWNKQKRVKVLTKFGVLLTKIRERLDKGGEATTDGMQYAMLLYQCILCSVKSYTMVYLLYILEAYVLGILTFPTCTEWFTGFACLQSSVKTSTPEESTPTPEETIANLEYTKSLLSIFSKRCQQCVPRKGAILANEGNQRWYDSVIRFTLEEAMPYDIKSD